MQQRVGNHRRTEEQLVPPLVNGVHLLLDALAVDVAIGDQAVAGVHHAADLLLAGVHGGHEVLLLLDGGLGAL